MERNADIAERLDYVSDRNLVLFHGKEFVAIYQGASGYEELSKGVRDAAIEQGLLTRHRFPSRQRLTGKAVKILRDNGLINSRE